MSTARHRVAIAGLGVMGLIHLRVLHALDDVEVVAAVDPDEARRATAARLHPGTPVFASLTEALDRGGPTAIGLATPPSHLPTLGHEALAAGVAVLVEKPVAPDESAAAALVADAQARGVLLAVGHVERCNPAVLALRERVLDGQVGEILQLSARRLSPFPDRDSMLGVALDLATHDIDIMRFLTGDEVQRVHGETAQRWHERAEDALVATLRFDGGAVGLLETNWLTPAKVRELTVTGTKGTFMVDYIQQELRFFEHPSSATTPWGALANVRGAGEGDMVRYALQRREPVRVEWETFLAALRGDGEPRAQGHDGLAALSVARAIQRSGVEGAPVRPAYRDGG